VAVSADNRLLAAGSHKDSIRIFEIASKNELFPHPASEEKAKEEKK